MRERVIEDLVFRYPEEILGETLRSVKRQMWIDGRRLDLLFEDTDGGLLLLELKAGEIQREHVGQAGEYFGLLRVHFPDRHTRVALLGTAITPERRLYLETFGVEVHVVTEQFLLDIAKRYGIDPEVGIPLLSANRPREARPDRVLSGGQFPVTDEASYFQRVNQLSDEGVKEKLAAIYAVAKKSVHLRISFSDAGSAEFTVEGSHGRRAKLMKIRVSFARRSPTGILTLYWKYMLKAFAPEQLRPFATLIDELLGRHKAHIYLDVNEKAGTFDEGIDLYAGHLDGHRFARFLEGLEGLVANLSEVNASRLS